MTPEVSERAFEDGIECALLRDGPDACPGDATAVREAPPFGDVPVLGAATAGAGRRTMTGGSA